MDVNKINDRLDFLSEWEWEINMADILDETDRQLLLQISNERQELISIRSELLNGK